jgi:anti-sigma regulatory factor (Ser/Thr protein kinase)
MTFPSESKAHRSYQHDAFLYAGDEDFLAGLVPFVREGVALGQPVMVAVTEPRLTKLRTAVAADAEAVDFVDMAELGHNPARIIPGWRNFVDQHGGPGRPVRGIGEPIWAGRRPAEIVECQLHEALLNLAVDPDTPLWLRCPYDTKALDGPVLDQALHSHPTVVEADDYRGSTAYGGAHHVGEMFARALPEPGDPTEQLSFDGSNLAAVRCLVSRLALDAGLDAGRTSDLTLALTELTTNSVRHGGGGGLLRMWEERDALVCEVADRGHVDDPLVGRRMPAETEEGGRGVWLANQLCDLVQLRSTAVGTVVRVYSWLAPRR